MRVLIATDGSPHAERAVALAAAQAWPPGVELRVVVVDDGQVAAQEVLGGVPVVVDVFDAAPEDLAELVSRATRALEGPGRAVSGEVLRGRAATVIVEEGERIGADVIILGSRGRGRLEALALGSVSSEVVDHAGRPVLVARGEGPLRRVVLADDGSAPAAHARQLVADWPIFAPAEIIVASVANVPAPLHSAIAPTMVRTALADHERTVDEARAARDRVAAEAAAALRAAGRRVSVQVGEGDPAGELIDTARESGADLIVVGSRGETGLARLLLGSVARNVLYEAPCSVLVVR